MTNNNSTELTKARENLNRALDKFDPNSPTAFRDAQTIETLTRVVRNLDDHVCFPPGLCTEEEGS